ncbi:BC1872 family protein [Paenibacillus kobensis]|uniref:BC1872 family protein n=1 Tax=Paenibacillus kobensis TaxID=59841 RepID=UPI000FD7F3C6|nr:hypothetical protein [Paenibacillus kobensis]
MSEQMQPGPVLNRLIATKLFGYEVHENLSIMWKTPGDPFVPILGYSTDWNAMRLVVEEMIRRGAEVNIGFYEDWDCQFDYKGTNFRDVSSTAPHAVCLAALQALEADQ